MKSAKKNRAFWTLAALALGLMTVQVARSEPGGTAKVFKAGDVLTADDLNANFAAVAALGAPAAPYAWNAFAQAQQDVGRLGTVGGVTEGRVATFSFSSPVAGDALLTASFEVRVRNAFDNAARDQCAIESLLSDTQNNPYGSCKLFDFCNFPGYAQSSINANLPTQDGGGSYLGLSQTVSRVLPLKQGLNTFYLIGRTSCPAGIWGAISFSALQVKKGDAATLSIP